MFKKSFNYQIIRKYWVPPDKNLTTEKISIPITTLKQLYNSYKIINSIIMNNYIISSNNMMIIKQELKKVDKNIEGLKLKK